MSGRWHLNNSDIFVFINQTKPHVQYTNITSEPKPKHKKCDERLHKITKCLWAFGFQTFLDIDIDQKNKPETL